MPVLKYAITGRDFGASLSYYNGFTKSAMSPFADTLKNKNDTILSIETNQIDSIIYFQNGRFNSETWKIYLKDDTSTIAITRYFPKYGPYGCVFFIPFYRNVDSPLDKETDPGMVQVQSKHGFINSPVRIKMSEFLHKLKIEDTVHLTAYPDQSHNNLLKPNSLINDLSFGIGISAYPKNK